MPSEEKLKHSLSTPVVVPAGLIPGFRTTVAVEHGVERNLLFRTWGGLGDQVCAEPTLRYALKNFHDCRISLASERPELFEHLKFHRVFNLKEERPVYENYLCFETITPPDDTNLVWQFMSHMLTNCVDFSSLCALRSQLPIAEKEVRLPGYPEPYVFKDRVYVHAGRHWPSKTFPSVWWEAVIDDMRIRGLEVVLIGANTDDNRGTVDLRVIPGVVDMRNKMSIRELIGALIHAHVVITNDSAPLHIAAPGRAWIGYVATCKHPDMITHWRQGEWGWRMENLGRGGLWENLNHCPNKMERVLMDKVEPGQLEKWLPEPQEVARWAFEKSRLRL